MNEKLIREAFVKWLPTYCFQRPPEGYMVVMQDAFIAGALAALDAEKVEYCEWDESGINGSTSCGRCFNNHTDIPVGIPCPYCFKPIRIKEPS